MPKKADGGKPNQPWRSPAGTGTPISVPQPKNCSKLQQELIKALVEGLYVNVSKKVNYDHVKLTIPKADLPLVYRSHRYDVSCLIDDRLVLLDVLNVSLNYWQPPRKPKNG